MFVLLSSPSTFYSSSIYIFLLLFFCFCFFIIIMSSVLSLSLFTLYTFGRTYSLSRRRYDIWIDSILRFLSLSFSFTFFLLLLLILLFLQFSHDCSCRSRLFLNDDDPVRGDNNYLQLEKSRIIIGRRQEQQQQRRRYLPSSSSSSFISVSRYFPHLHVISLIYFSLFNIFLFLDSQNLF